MSRRGRPSGLRPRLAPSVLVVLAAVLVIGACATTLGRDELAVEYYNIGSAYFDLGELEKSARYLTRALDLSPELARASYNLARVYVLQGRYDRAFELLDTLLSRDPGNSLVLETIAFAHYLAGDLEEAAYWYDRALDVGPTDLDLLQNRATVAQEAGRHDLAVRFLRRAVDLADNRPQLALSLAESERELGRNDAAIEAYRAYLEGVATAEPGALLSYAEVLEAEEYYAAALDVLDRLVERDDAKADVRARASFVRGRILLAHAREQESGIEAIRAALRLGYADEEGVSDLLSAVPAETVPALRAVLIDADLLHPGAEPTPESDD